MSMSCIQAKFHFLLFLLPVMGNREETTILFSPQFYAARLNMCFKCSIFSKNWCHKAEGISDFYPFAWIRTWHFKTKTVSSLAVLSSFLKGDLWVLSFQEWPEKYHRICFSIDLSCWSHRIWFSLHLSMTESYYFALNKEVFKKQTNKQTKRDLLSNR